MTLDEFANMACANLPEGWEIGLVLRGGEFDLVLTHHCEEIELEAYCSVDDSLLCRAIKAVDYAIRSAENENL